MKKRNPECRDFTTHNYLDAHHSTRCRFEIGAARTLDMPSGPKRINEYAHALIAVLYIKSAQTVYACKQKPKSGTRHGLLDVTNPIAGFLLFENQTVGDNAPF